MTRKEAIRHLEYLKVSYPLADVSEWVDMAIEALQTEAVRCKDCRHKVTTKDGEYNPEDIVCDYWATDGLEETDFCSYGERKGGEDE